MKIDLRKFRFWYISKMVEYQSKVNKGLITDPMFYDRGYQSFQYRKNANIWYNQSKKNKQLFQNLIAEYLTTH